MAAGLTKLDLNLGLSLAMIEQKYINKTLRQRILESLNDDKNCSVVKVTKWLHDEKQEFLCYSFIFKKV